MSTGVKFFFFFNFGVLSGGLMLEPALLSVGPVQEGLL